MESFSLWNLVYCRLQIGMVLLLSKCGRLRVFDHNKYRMCLMLMLLIASMFSSALYAEDNKIAVLYPKVREPFNQVFLSVYGGIKAASQEKVLKYEVGKGEPPEKLQAWLKKKKIAGIVALGGRSVGQLKKIDGFDLPYVSGASILQRSNTSSLVGISMAPEPLKLFSQLKVLTPGVKRINVVYEKGKEDWLIEHAREVAEAEGLTINATPIENLKEMAEAYRKVLAKQEQETEALWLPKSGRSLEKALMYKMLEDSWKRNLIVFSSKFSDVKKGVLFSLYPDNKAMGESLYALLVKYRENPELEPKVILSEDLLKAINTRTADHLGIRLTNEQKSTYQYLYPPKS